jgi:hypothetical protein
MPRQKEAPAIPTVHEALDVLTIEQLQPLVALLPTPARPTRKGELVALIERAGRCWGLCRRRHLVYLNVHVWIPALEDGPQLPVQRLYARLQQQMRTGFGPLHLLFFTEAFAHDLIHRGLHKTRRDRLAVVIALPIIRYQVPVVPGLCADTSRPSTWRDSSCIDRYNILA